MYISKSDYNLMLRKIPILCVDLIIIYKKKCLLLKRKNEPAKDQYWFPGGRINKMESIKKAAIRKAKEEVNINCKFREIISVEETMFKKTENMFTDIHTVNICCKLVAVSINEINIDKLHSNYIWVTLNKAEKMNLHNAVIKPLEKVFKKLI